VSRTFAALLASASARFGMPFAESVASHLIAIYALRLTQARRALLSAERGTVTQIAMRFGFLELGRFAVDYRSTFGERPSETLRRSLSVQLCKS